MKRISIILISLFILFAFSACTNSPELSDVKATDMAASLKEATVFVDDMLEISDEVAADFYNLPDGVTEMKVYMSSSGATAEELAVFKCDSAGTVDLVVKACEKRIEDLKEKFEDYIPGELAKIDNAVIKQRDAFVTFVCADSTVPAEEEFEDYKYYRAE